MLNCRGKIIELTPPKVMGILNLTDDSFYDGGRCKNIETALNHTGKMLEEGADFIDIGAVSTRPGAKSINSIEEWNILGRYLIDIRKAFPEAHISIDTYRAEVARNAIEEGADIINDISAGSFDSNMFNVIAHYHVPYIMMHIQGTPENMQIKPIYENVVKEILQYFSQRIQKLKTMGVCDIIIDPGIGFGKTIKHNFEILNNLEIFTALGYPVLIGLSRKSLIYKTLQTTPDNALNGTTVLNTMALNKGVKILRVHDVKEAVEAVKLLGLMKED